MAPPLYAGNVTNMAAFYAYMFNHQFFAHLANAFLFVIWMHIFSSFNQRYMHTQTQTHTNTHNIRSSHPGRTLLLTRFRVLTGRPCSVNGGMEHKNYTPTKSQRVQKIKSANAPYTRTRARAPERRDKNQRRLVIFIVGVRAHTRTITHTCIHTYTTTHTHKPCTGHAGVWGRLCTACDSKPTVNLIRQYHTYTPHFSPYSQLRQQMTNHSNP